MSKFGIAELSARKKNRISGFNAGYADRPGPKQKKSMGLGRTIGSALSIILGGTLCYVSLHYMPAFVDTRKIIAASKLDQSSTRLQDENSGFLLKAYWDAFSIRRTYLRDGQSIQAQYALPAGTELELGIKRCRPAFILEVFNCEVIGEKSFKITDDQTGTQRFQFQGKGFYLFEEKLSGVSADTKSISYRVVWSRA
ncbi:hypothetical protein [Litorimonas sp.]|uniref:hypothetical protein n=1 Tax=Litorimonas sp. TaxID=1892381 RepID=UPI003A889CD5